MLERLRTWVVGLGRDPGLKLAALMFSLLAWTWVQSQESDTARVRVQLDLRFADRLVPVEPPPATASIEVTGPRVLIRRAQAERPRLLVDLRDEGIGPHEIHLDAYPLEGMPSGLAVVGFAPEVLAVRLDQRARRNVKVEAVWVGEPAADHDVERVAIDPRMVEVSGPRAVLDELTRIRTMPIDVSGWDTTRDVDIELDLPRGVESLAPWHGTASVEVSSVLKTVTLTDVPVVVLRNDGYAPAEGESTVTVSLEGPTQVLDELRSDQILATVSLPDGAGAGRYTATFEAAHAPRLDLIYPRPDVVHVKSAPDSVTVVKR